MKTKLFDYQEKIVNEQSNRKSVNLFLGMGTGKTITSLALFEKNPTHKILIICLISKMQDWADDLKKELNIDATILNKGSSKNMELLNNGGNAYIINFESAWRCLNLLKWVDNDTTILIDESHKCKSVSSKIGRFITKLKDKTKYKLILTGTPQSSGYIDYYNQLRFTDTFTMSYKEFCDKYCVYQTMNFTGYPFKKLTGYQHTDELDKIINSNCAFFERSLNNELIPSDIDIKLETPKKYKPFKKVRIYEDYVADNSSKLFVSLRTLCSGFIDKYDFDKDKLKWLKDFIEDLNDRVVIYYNFNKERDDIISLLTTLNIPYSEYNGRTKDLTKFKSNKNGVALCQYISASTGLNDLVLSHLCVFYSPTLNYIDFSQAKKRLDRIGQTQKPLYYYLYCKGTVEEQIYDALKRGKDFDEKMFNQYLTLG